MGDVVPVSKAKFSVGQLVHHRLFNYRGVIVDVDPEFSASQAWYESIAKSKPPKDKPWYHVLVDGSQHATYVAERNLEPDTVEEPVFNPMLELFFSKFEGGKYVRTERDN